MRRHSTLLLLVLLSITMTASADSRRRAVAPVSSATTDQIDTLRIGTLSGAAVSGSVASVSGTTIVLNGGGNSPITIDATTARFATRTQAVASIDDVAPGGRITAFIESSRPLQPGAPLPARWIIIESAPDLAVTGAIDAIDLTGSTFTVLGISILVDADTSYSTAFPTFAPILALSDLAVGQVVAVTATFSSDSIVANRVHILSPNSMPSVILGGTVKSIGETVWVITQRDGNDVDVLVNAQTRMLGNPKSGDTVQVMANVDGGGAYVAIAIVKVPTAPPDDVRFELRGSVKSIARDRWVVSDALARYVTIRITPVTLVYRDPRVGDHVNVLGFRDRNGEVIAVLISRER